MNKKYLLAVKTKETIDLVSLNEFDDFQGNENEVNDIIEYVSNQDEVKFKSKFNLKEKIQIVLVYKNKKDKLIYLPFDLIYKKNKNKIDLKEILDEMMKNISNKNLLNHLYQKLNNLITKNQELEFSPFFLDFAKSVQNLKDTEVNYLRYMEKLESYIIALNILQYQTRKELS